MACRRSRGRCGAGGWPVGAVAGAAPGDGGAFLDGRPAGAVAGAAPGDGRTVLTKERGRSAAASTPSTPSTLLCRALETKDRRMSAAAAPRHQGEGEERRALEARPRDKG